jgi:hypothetical protein
MYFCEKMSYDEIRNPTNNKKYIEKYSGAWYHFLRNGYKEYDLELMPIFYHASAKARMGLVKELNLETFKPARGGVILYTINNGQLLFGFGLDDKYGELTDFSGGISYKRDNNAVRGALRELKEESLGLYDVSVEQVQNAHVLYDKYHLVLFLYTNDNTTEVVDDFRERHQQTIKSELKDIVWITEDELRKAIRLKSSYIYIRLLNFLAKAGNFYFYLK